MKLENRVIGRDGSLRWVEWSTARRAGGRSLLCRGPDVTVSRRAAAEQAALRRVATLVARETAPDAVFAAVGREVGEVLGVDATHLGRYDADGTVVSVAQWGSSPGVPIGARFPLEGDSVSARVLGTGRPARMDDYEDAPGVIAATIRQIGVRFSIGVPIFVGGADVGRDDRHFEGCGAVSRGDPVAPPGLHGACCDRDLQCLRPRQGRVLADEQAALRRVATLVAQQPPQDGGLRGHRRGDRPAARRSIRSRWSASRTTAPPHSWPAGVARPALPVGTRVPLGGRNVASLVFRTGRAARLDGYYESASGPSPTRRGRGALGRGNADRRGGPAMGRHARGQRARSLAAT